MRQPSCFVHAVNTPEDWLCQAMSNHNHSLPLRCVFESVLCAMAMGTCATIVFHGLRIELKPDEVPLYVIAGTILGVLFSPITCGFVPFLDRGYEFLNAWPGIVVFFGVLVGLAATQSPLPETAASIRLFGPLCRVLLRIYRYTCYLWLIFIPVGTVIGIACIMYLRRPEEPSKQRVDNEPPDTVITSMQPTTHEQPRSS